MAQIYQKYANKLNQIVECGPEVRKKPYNNFGIDASHVSCTNARYIGGLKILRNIASVEYWWYQLDLHLIFS